MTLPAITREYATPTQVKLLKKFKTEGTLSERKLTRPLWLTNRQASELGYTVGEGEDFLLSPTEPEDLFGGVTTPLEPEELLPISPEVPEDTFSLIARLFPRYPGLKPEDLEAELETKRASLAEDPEAFLLNLNRIATPEERDAVLRVLGADEETVASVDEFLGQQDLTKLI